MWSLAAKSALRGGRVKTPRPNLWTSSTLTFTVLRQHYWHPPGTDVPIHQFFSSLTSSKRQGTIMQVPRQSTDNDLGARRPPLHNLVRNRRSSTFVSSLCATSRKFSVHHFRTFYTTVYERRSVVDKSHDDGGKSFESISQRVLKTN